MNDLFFSRKRSGLFILSFGGGQDSTAILYKLILDPNFRMAWLNGKNLVVTFCDTGNEHPETYEHIEYIKDLCGSYGIKFVHISPDHENYHSDSWQSLQHQFEKNECIAMRGTKSCTDNLKIKPFYRWLDHFCSVQLGNESVEHYAKTHLVEYAQKHGQIEVAIGFTAEEQNRITKASRPGIEKWWESIQKVFPLDIEGLTRADCIDIMNASPFNTCQPSNCIMCPNISKQELVYLWRFHRADFMIWAEYERAKFKKWAGKTEKNTGTLGRQLSLMAELEIAIEKHGHMSNQQLKDYKFSHGHCISNGY